MTSTSFNFKIPESLRIKKTINSPSEGSSISATHPYSPSRRPFSSSPSRSKSLSKPPVGSRSAIGQHSTVRPPTFVRKTLPSRHISQSLHSRSTLSSAHSGALIEKRLKSSRSGTLRSGVDNRFIGGSRKAESPKTRARDLSVKDEVATKIERRVDASKVESVTEKIVLPKGAVARQLRRMIGRICESDFEKYQILDERDRLMQGGRLKTADVRNATVIQGTCSDMCPEKERYLRVVQKRLSTYECYEDGRMAPELTVKEYSRSAADQEEPLPHELRPADVLHRTMNYLVGKIANLIPETDEELAQWYDFLWNRTRAIRKDITQQMMVNDTAVRLIEQCVRLHIFASHRLCELNFNDFDQKMNTENLSKSLQSLRYLYDDLAKKGVFYSSEAEFRAYEIMLNLSDSNVFRQALTYRREILEAGPVRLAIRMFTCLQNHNYVRFFRLLKNDATYLQCCLCHRYFSRMRHQAMYAMSHSVNVTGKYPLNKFVSLLGFDDREVALQFLDCYNVRRFNDLDTGEELMLMSKTRLIDPIDEPPSTIHVWIEEKRDMRSLTEVLSGGQIVEVQIKMPVNSFDVHGTYVFDVVLNDYVSEFGNEQLTSNEDEAVVLPESRKENDVVDILAERLVDQLINEEMTRICMRTFIKPVVHSLTTVLYDGILEDCLKPYCQELLMGAKLLHRHKLIAHATKHQQNDIRSLLNSLNESVVHEVIDEFIQDVSREWILEHQRLNNRRFLDDIGERFLHDVVTEVITETVGNIGESKIEESVQQRLKEINERLYKLWLKQFIDCWRKQIACRREKERKRIEFLETFPLIPAEENGLIFYRRDGYPIEQGPIDCSSLSIEQEVDAFVKKRHARIAHKVTAKWRSWTKLQIKKREFFTITEAPFLSRQRKRRIPTQNDFDMRLALTLAEVECNRTKQFLGRDRVQNSILFTNNAIPPENLSHCRIEEQETGKDNRMSWYESLAKRSSDLLVHFDKETLEGGLQIARRNSERVHGVRRITNCLGWEEDLSYNLSQPLLFRNYTRTSEMKVKEEQKFIEKKKKLQHKDLDEFAEQIKHFAKEVDNVFKDVNECDKHLKALGVDI